MKIFTFGWVYFNTPPSRSVLGWIWIRHATRFVEASANKFFHDRFFESQKMFCLPHAIVGNYPKWACCEFDQLRFSLLYTSPRPRD